MPIKIFFCYSRRDEALLDKLKAHLRPLQRQGLIDLWHDRDISAGDDWEQAITQQLNEADIILLLVSPDFMESDYCYGKEMQRALERHANRECVVVPIILRPVYWHGEPLGKLQALPTDGKPVTGTGWHDQDSASYDVVMGIHKVIAEKHIQQAKVIAEKHIQPSGPAKDAIELEFLSAYTRFRNMSEEEKKTKFELFLNAFDALEAAFRYYKETYPLDTIQADNLQQARNYKQALESLQRALRTGYAENIVASYNPSLINNQRLAPDELEAVLLSKQFLAADWDEDDNALLTTVDKMKRFGITPSLPSSFQFTPEDEMLIERARQRLNALKTFKEVLETKRLTKIAASYDPILENSRALSKDDRELLQLAQEFTAALSQNDDAIVAAYKHILLSPQRSSIAFDEKERKLITNAQQTVNERFDFYASTVAKLKTKEISIELLYKACLFYYERFSAHNRYFDYILSINPLEEAKTKAIRGKQELEEAKTKAIRGKQELQEKMLAKNITTETLKSLINDLFITERMREEKIQKEFLEIYQAQHQLESEFIYFQNIATPTYEIFINTHSMSEQEIKTFTSIPLRYTFYKAYFADQQSISNLRKTTLDDWLEKQRKEVSFLHNTLEQTAQRISESPYWKI